jgi:hypothetical protein
VKALFLAIALGMLGCQTGLTDEAPYSDKLDEAYFRCRVQPVITKSCAALACHGDVQRYYHVFGRNRLRLGGGEEKRNAQLSAQERAFNYNATRAIVDAAKPAESYLLLKPLESSAGGYYHGGATLFKKGNVFLNREDPDFKTLEKWVNGEKEDPACIEPGSDS